MIEPLSFAFYLSSVPFTKDVLTWQKSLGGSESACLVTMRALAARGHRILAFAEQLQPDLAGWTDDGGVQWWPAQQLPDAMTFMRFDVFVSLRMPSVFGMKLTSKLNVLWGQDMLTQTIAGGLSQCDLIAYVSDWQKRQWAAVDDVLPRVRSFITPNAIDPSHFEGMPAYRAPNPKAPRFIHVSRPERGLDGLLALWPKIRVQWPTATLALCRYSSMYDAHGWGQVCNAYDQKVAMTHAKVGGIEWLGELTKRELYQAISSADLMLYPTSQAGFGETNCIACTESQMCGTPFLGSARGALPETLHPEAGRLLEMSSPDCWQDADWQDQWIRTMAEMLDPMTHRRMAKAGREQAVWTYGPVVAEHWERSILAEFAHRAKTYPAQILKRFLNDDNHVLARRLLLTPAGAGVDGSAETLAFCNRVIAGEDQVAEDYADRAIQDGKFEGEHSQRIKIASEHLAEWLPENGAVLDYACGNGSFLWAMRHRRPDAELWGVDYSEGVLKIAKDTITDANFIHAGNVEVWEREFDGAFCGEFLEHVESPWAVLSMLEERVKDGGPIVLTMPSGPWTELMPFGAVIKRGHLWMYDERDLRTLFGSKRDARWQYFRVGDTPKGSPVGFWLVRYRCDKSIASPVFSDAYQERSLLTERPYMTIHASMIMKNEEQHILRCLHSIRHVCDKVVIYDTGSTDASIELAEKAGAMVIRGDFPDNFGEARNRALSAASYGADAVLWIDADEKLTAPPKLRDTVTHQAPFIGWALKQYHFQADKPNFFDKPVRVFRTGHGVQFFGMVHEQPGLSLNDGVIPTLMMESCMLLHLGYETPDVRVNKMLYRNLDLLMAEIHGEGPHPPRDLAWVLAMRDAVNLTVIDGYDGHELNRKGMVWLAQAMKMYTDRFTDASHPLHHLAYTYYQQALTASGVGIGVKWGFAASKNIKDVKIRPETFRALTTDEAQRTITERVTGWMKDLEAHQSIPVPPPAETGAIVRRSAPVEGVSAG